MVYSYYISQQGITNLNNYQYKGSDQSYIVPYLQPYYNWCASKLPKWMAPNMVTLIGFLAIIYHFLQTTFFCPTMKEEAPWWVWVVNAMCLWFYMTMDAIDGKHARATGTSSPLGELFDHGCDALSSMFQTITMGCAFQIGKYPLMAFVLLFGVNLTFFFSIWEQYFTGVLRCDPYAGPTEALIVSTIAHLITATFPSLWHVNITSLFGLSGSKLPNIEIYHLAIASSFFAIIPTLNINFKYAIGAVQEYSSSKRAKKGSLFRATIPFVILFSCFFLWTIISPDNIFVEKTLLMFALFGLLNGYIVTRLTLSKITDETCQTWYIILTPFPFIVLHAFLSKFVFGTVIIRESLILTLYLTYILGMYAHMVVDVIDTFCEHLDIYCLTIKPKIQPIPSENNSGDNQRAQV